MSYAACLSKRRFTCRMAAENALASARQMVRVGRQCTAPVALYSCPRCGGWHLTKKTQAEYEATRAAYAVANRG
jgi:hypothetical protein